MLNMLALCLFLVPKKTGSHCTRSIWRPNSNNSSSLFKSSVYLVNNVFIVADEFLEGNNRLPRVILSVDATAGDLIVFVSGYSQRVSTKKTKSQRFAQEIEYKMCHFF